MYDMTSSQIPAPLQPTLKAPSTARSSRLVAIADNTPASRSSSRVPEPRPKRQDALNNDDFTSDRATTALIKRVLVPESNTNTDAQSSTPPIEHTLPPLTSSNDIDVQLYAILAIIFKDFVNTWYSRITPDHTFLEEVIQIVAHCSRAVEERVRHTDVVELCLNDIPILVQRHTHAYRTAKSSQATFPYGNHKRQIYHTLNPHPALNTGLSAEAQIQAERVYRQLLIQGALAALLPTEDLQNSCLRILVTDIIADLILGRSLGDRVCEPWFIYGAVSKVVGIVNAKVDPKLTAHELKTDTRGRLQKFGLLSGQNGTGENHTPEHHQTIWSTWFWRIMQHAYLIYLTLRYFVNGLIHAETLPSRATQQASRGSVDKTSVGDSTNIPTESSVGAKSACAVLTYRISSLISTLLMLPYRMPWLVSTLTFWQHALLSGFAKFGGMNTSLDKFLHHSLETYVFSPSLLPSILLNVRATIFPGNTMGPPAPPPPSAEEALQIRRRAASDILTLIPAIVAKTVFATSDHEEQIRQIDQDILEVFSDTNMNKHLIYGILELVLVRLIPEMVGQTPGELLAERGVMIDYGEKEIL